MRNITIQRNKSIVGAIGKRNVYIEDHENRELVINGVPCRKLGSLKNGEEKTFSITQEQVRLFVISDKLSRNFASEMGVLAAGEKDILLTGKNKLDPLRGSPFRFDGNDGETARAHRRRGRCKAAAILVLGAVAAFLAGYGVGVLLQTLTAPREKAFSVQGMTVVLTEEFREIRSEDVLAAYGSKNVGVVVSREDCSMVEDFASFTREEYAAMVAQANQDADVDLKIAGDLLYLEYLYTEPGSGAVYRYYSFVFKSHDSFWLIQFSVQDSLSGRYEAQILQWAAGVTFEKENSRRS